MTDEHHQPPGLHLGVYILAGGQSSRMGTDKIWIDIEGKPLIERSVAFAHAISDSVAILSGPAETGSSFERNALLSCYAGLVPDLIPNCGPLSGIHAALTHTKLDWNLILPVDVPFLPADLVRRWIASCASPRQDASWMRLGDADHPLPLLVRSTLRAPLETQLNDGRWSVRKAIESAVGSENQARIAIYPVERTAASERWFTNLNSPADLPGSSEHVISSFRRTK